MLQKIVTLPVQLLALKEPIAIVSPFELKLTEQPEKSLVFAPVSVPKCEYPKLWRVCQTDLKRML